MQQICHFHTCTTLLNILLIFLMFVLCGICFRVGPRRQAKLARLRQVENKLLEHPLSLYPHLREGIPTEVRYSSDDIQYLIYLHHRYMKYMYMC